MGQGVNRVFLIGNLGKDPEVRYTQSGQAVASLAVATTDSWTDKQGQRQDRTEWHRVVAWGKTAELCGEHLSKGRQVYLEGKLQTRQYQDKDGVTRYTTEVVVNQVQFLGSKNDGQGGGGGQPRTAPVDDLGYGAEVAQQQQAPARPQQQAPLQGTQQQGQGRNSYPTPPEQAPRRQQQQQQQQQQPQYGGREPGYDDQDNADDLPF